MSINTEQSIISQSVCTLPKILEQLKVEGYTEDLSKESNQQKYFQDDSYLENFTIDKTLRVDVDSNPDDQTIVYALSCKGTGLKGYFVNAFGIYGDPKIDEIVRKLH
jgi:hypothetical protein